MAFTVEQLKATRTEDAHGCLNRQHYSLWDGEVHIEIIYAECVYGFRSAVMLINTCGNGVRAEQYSPYGRNGDRWTLYADLDNWLVAQLNDLANGAYEVSQIVAL